MTRKAHMSMISKALKVLERGDLDHLAKAIGMTTEPERSMRLDLEYALLALEDRERLARMTVMKIMQALNREMVK